MKKLWRRFIVWITTEDPPCEWCLNDKYCPYHEYTVEGGW